MRPIRFNATQELFFNAMTTPEADFKLALRLLENDALADFQRLMPVEKIQPGIYHHAGRLGAKRIVHTYLMSSSMLKELAKRMDDPHVFCLKKVINGAIKGDQWALIDELLKRHSISNDFIQPHMLQCCQSHECLSVLLKHQMGATVFDNMSWEAQESLVEHTATNLGVVLE